MAETKKTPVEKAKGQNLNAAATYVLGWITGLLFLLIEKKDDFVRFNAAQSVIVFGALTVLSMVPVVGWVVSPFLFLGGVVLWVFLMVKAYQGEKVMLPLVGTYAEQLKEKIK